MFLDSMDIDMVYCWCDGNDPEFINRKTYYLDQDSARPDNDSVGNHRFIDNDELRYSLRSLFMYAPWIHHVYIVTDRQTPKWLNLDYEKVSVIDHSVIMSPDLIPTFSAIAIEQHIANIPGLSEHFLYGNDDTFFGRPLTPSFFFTDEGEPIVFVKRFEKFKSIHGEVDFQKKYNIVSTWMKTNLISWKLLYERYHHQDFYVLSHTIDGYCKSLFQATLARYQDYLQDTLPSRFRNEREISRSLFGLDAYYSGHGDLKLIDSPGFWKKYIHKPSGYSWECYCGSEDRKTRQEIRRFNPYVFCVNADAHSTPEDKKAMREFYQQLFPTASPFELPEK